MVREDKEGKEFEPARKDRTSVGPDTPEGQAAMAGPLNTGDADLRAYVHRKQKQLEEEIAADGASLSEQELPALQEIREQNYRWEDRGMQNVDVAALPWPDGISGPEDFDRLSYEDALRTARELANMQPLIDGGYTREDFAQDDEARGFGPGDGRARVYDLFYGSQPVQVLKDGQHYSVPTGRHRVFAAKVVGLKTLPARVREKVQTS